jgi:glycosyltransferase involved in cell wall biosynthesis
MNSADEITVVRVIARLNVGGPAMQAILMTDAFRQKGYRALLLTGEVLASEGSMEYLARAKDVEPIKIATMSRSISSYKDLAALWRIIRILRREKPLVIHTHTAKAGALGRIAALVTRVPVRVHTFHGHVFQGYFSPFVTRIFLMFERFLARHSDCIVAVSESQRKELVETYHIAPAQKTAVIPLGFDMNPFLGVNGREGSLRRSLAYGPDTALVGWIGRLTPIKAPGSFLHSAALVHAQFFAARFVMVGDGELRRACELRIRSEGLDSVVTIIGWQRQLAPIYADLDLVVSTSINEGTPVALLEAMASARPFVATDVGGVRDLMKGCGRMTEGMEVFDNGILVPRDPHRVAHAIRHLLARPALRKAMGQAGRKFVSSQFSQHRLANDLESLYLSLAHSKGLLQSKFPSLAASPLPFPRKTRS